MWSRHNQAEEETTKSTFQRECLQQLHTNSKTFNAPKISSVEKLSTNNRTFSITEVIYHTELTKRLMNNLITKI